MYGNTVEESRPAASGRRSRAAIIAIAPFVMLAAFVTHPHITFLPDANAVAHAVNADTVRWAVAHWAIGIAAALMAAAWAAVREHFRDAGEDRWSALALPFLVFAAATYAILPGMEFTVIPPATFGGDIVASQHLIDTWFTPTLLLSGLTNGIGVVLLARAVRSSGVLDEGPRGLIIGALYVMALARLVPIGPVQFYVQGLAAIVALWPIALDVMKRTGQLRGRPVGENRPRTAAAL